MKNVIVLCSEELSKDGKKRFVVVDKDTGEIVDDAQGYGYKSAQGAHKGWSYKSRDKSKDAEKKKRENEIRAWIKSNSKFRSAMDILAWDMIESSCEPDFKLNAKAVRDLLAENNIECEYPAGELLRVWLKR